MTRVLGVLLGLSLGLALLVVSGSALAHGLGPIGVRVSESGERSVQVEVQRAKVQPQGFEPKVVLPEGCRADGAAALTTRDEVFVQRQRYRCETQLAGAELSVGGLAEGMPDAVLEVRLGNGEVHRTLLTEDQSGFVVPAERSATQTAGAYVWLGFLHMLGGLDHVLFVLALWFLATSRRQLVVVLTSFTGGHSLTLAAAGLGWVVLPSAWVEVGIAASVLALAVAVLRRRAEEPWATPTWRLALTTAGLGLLHGLGFASALADVGFAPGDMLVGLLAFNCGVEMAQLLVVGVMALASLLLRGISRDPGRAALGLRLAGHALGGFAGLFLIERVWVLF